MISRMTDKRDELTSRRKAKVRRDGDITPLAIFGLLEQTIQPVPDSEMRT
jgi:hypothetical protein